MNLLLILLVQFGSVGFTFYKNDCFHSNATSFSFKHSACCCKKGKAVKSEKKCCKKKTSSCCASANQLQIEKKCCHSTPLFFKVLSEPFFYKQINLDFENKLHQNKQYSVTSFSVQKTTNQHYYQCNSPPQKNYDSRIFIQSLQI